jgi:transposase
LVFPTNKGAQEMIYSMSQQEFSRVDVLKDLIAKRINAEQAAQILDLTCRQVFRLKRRFERLGPAGLISPRRGRPSNRRLPESLRSQVIGIVRECYADFGPTLAAEKLKELNGIAVSKETLRTWMSGEGIWLSRKARRKTVHQPRYRRECLGELVQIDGSEHWWFEDRGPQCTLLVYVDDATSRLMHLQFVESESTFSYFAATRAYLERYGKPVAFYSDKHGVFRVNMKGAISGDGMTQFGRALKEQIRKLGGPAK